MEKLGDLNTFSPKFAPWLRRYPHSYPSDLKFLAFFTLLLFLKQKVLTSSIELFSALTGNPAESFQQRRRRANRDEDAWGSSAMPSPNPMDVYGALKKSRNLWV